MITPEHSEFIWNLVQKGFSNYIIIEESKKAGFIDTTDEEISEVVEENESQLSGCFMNGDCCR